MNLKFTRPSKAAPLLEDNIEHTDENIYAAMKQLTYPVLATRKKDGIRGVKFNVLASCTLKAIPNRQVQEMAQVLPRYFDVEIGNEAMTYNQIQSIVMSRDKDASKLLFYLIDRVGDDGYYARIRDGIDKATAIDSKLISWEEPQFIPNAAVLLDFFRTVESEHGEGICFRSPNGRYKCGRSTLKEQLLVKLCRYLRTELVIVGFKEQLENGNPDLYNDIGYMKRETFKENMIPKDTLGAFICKNLDGTDVDVGTGVDLTDKLRKEIWYSRDKWLGKQITVKYKPHGMKDKLRSPIYVGPREKGY